MLSPSPQLVWHRQPIPQSLASLIAIPQAIHFRPAAIKGQILDGSPGKCSQCMAFANRFQQPVETPNQTCLCSVCGANFTAGHQQKSFRKLFEQKTQEVEGSSHAKYDLYSFTETQRDQMKPRIIFIIDSSVQQHQLRSLKMALSQSYRPDLYEYGLVTFGNKVKLYDCSSPISSCYEGITASYCCLNSFDRYFSTDGYLRDLRRVSYEQTTPEKCKQSLQTALSIAKTISNGIRYCRISIISSIWDTFSQLESCTPDTIIDLWLVGLDATADAKSFQKISQRGGRITPIDIIEEERLKMAFLNIYSDHVGLGAVLRVILPQQLAVSGLLGSCTLLKETGLSEITSMEIGEGTTDCWALHCIDDFKTVTCVINPSEEQHQENQRFNPSHICLQLVIRYYSPRLLGRLITTVITISIPCAYTLVEMPLTFDACSAAAYLAKMCTHKRLREERSNLLTLIDRTVYKWASVISQYSKGSKESFTIQPQCAQLLPLVYGLRRARFLASSLNSNPTSPRFNQQSLGITSSFVGLYQCYMILDETPSNISCMLFPAYLTYTLASEQLRPKPRTYGISVKGSVTSLHDSCCFLPDPLPSKAARFQIHPETIVIRDAYFWTEIIEGSTVKHWRVWEQQNIDNREIKLQGDSTTSLVQVENNQTEDSEQPNPSLIWLLYQPSVDLIILESSRYMPPRRVVQPQQSMEGTVFQNKVIYVKDSTAKKQKKEAKNQGTNTRTKEQSNNSTSIEPTNQGNQNRLSRSENNNSNNNNNRPQELLYFHMPPSQNTLEMYVLHLIQVVVAMEV